MLRPLINKVRCTKCDVLIESRHSHDLKTCKCGAIFIDGGTEYQRYGWGANYSSKKNESVEDNIDFSYSVYEKTKLN